MLLSDSVMSMALSWSSTYSHVWSIVFSRDFNMCFAAMTHCSGDMQADCFKLVEDFIDEVFLLVLGGDVASSNPSGALEIFLGFIVGFCGVMGIKNCLKGKWGCLCGMLIQGDRYF